MIFYIVTSFVAFNIEPQNDIQHTNTPWISSSLSRSQYESLFVITPEMQDIMDKELHAYISEILNLLCEEKVFTTNIIDSLVANIGSNDHHNKYYPSCKEQNIDNRKQVCPKCKTHLPTLAELPKQPTLELEKIIINQPTIYKPYIVEKETKLSTAPRISITQKQSIDQGVNIPEIFVPDPLNTNPNSIANIEKVLLHIEKITGIKDGIRQWVAVTCDGIPYHRIVKIREKYPWLVLIPEQLYEEINMLHAYVELSW